MSGWGSETCAAVDAAGQRCVLQPGHQGNHITTVQQAAPRSREDTAKILLMALAALVVVAVVFLVIKGNLDAIL